MLKEITSNQNEGVTEGITTKRPGLCIRTMTPTEKYVIKKSAQESKQVIEKENIPKILSKVQKRLFKTKSDNQMNLDILTILEQAKNMKWTNLTIEYNLI